MEASTGEYTPSPLYRLNLQVLGVSMKICKIQDCNKPVRAQGYCQKHYDRQRYLGKLKHVHERHGKRWTAEYRTWISMKGRCLNPNDQAYKWYGARGITICQEWINSFSAFLNDMGIKPFKKATIDRIDNNGNYCPENCRWVDYATNNRNQSTTKLTKNQVREIRYKYKNSNIQQKKLAQQYQVTIGSINGIIKNRTWKAV